LATSVKLERRTEYYDWDEDIFPSVQQKIDTFEREGVKPTLRGLLYVLESMDVLKKTDYNGLNKHLTKWRENWVKPYSELKKKKGARKLPIDCIADNTRKIMDIHHYERYDRVWADFDEKLQSWDDIVTPKKHIESGIKYFDNTMIDLYRHIPRWIGQENYVEAFVEKDAIAGSIKSILDNGDAKSEYGAKSRQVVVVPNRGWSSYTFVMKNLNRLLLQRKRGKKVHVQYYGDSDPSGERMTAEDSKLVKKLSGYDIHFERIAITEDTIRDFEGLEDIKNKELDAATLKKLEDNPNCEWFKARQV
jgi:hypothetical protein